MTVLPILVSGGVGLSHAGNSYVINGVTGSAYLGPWEVQAVPIGREFGRRRADPSKPSKESWIFIIYMGVCVGKVMLFQAGMGMGGE